MNKYPLVIALLLLPLDSTFAVPIYDETTDGDLGANDISPFRKIVLQEGINNILGFTSLSNDLDNFVFEVPSGFKLNKLSWSATGLVEWTHPEPFFGFFELYYKLFDGSPTHVGQLIEASVTTATNPQAVFAFTTQGPSDWVMMGLDKVGANGGGYATFNFEFDVGLINPIPPRAVPEPNTVLLFGLGFSLLTHFSRSKGFQRKRKFQKNT